MPSDGDIGIWYSKLPWVTKCLFLVGFVLSLLGMTGVLRPEWVCLPGLRNWYEAVWRVPLSFLYHGPLSLGLIFHGYFFVTASSQLEERLFAGRPYAFVWLLMATGLLLLPPCFLLGLPFPSSCLTAALLFIMCRAHPNAVMRFMFGIQVQALYFPLVMLGLEFLMGGSLVATVVGLLAGHAYAYHELLNRQGERVDGAFLPLAGFYDTPKPLLRMQEGHRKALLERGILPQSWRTQES